MSLTSGKHTKSELENHHFNGYVKLPEGNKQVTQSNMIDSIKKNSDLTGMDWTWLALRGCQTGLAEKFSLNMHSNGKVIQLHG
jgi:hypothetical protein